MTLTTTTILGTQTIMKNMIHVELEKIFNEFQSNLSCFSDAATKLNTLLLVVWTRLGRNSTGKKLGKNKRKNEN